MFVTQKTERNEEVKAFKQRKDKSCQRIGRRIGANCNNIQVDGMLVINKKEVVNKVGSKNGANPFTRRKN